MSVIHLATTDMSPANNILSIKSCCDSLAKPVKTYCKLIAYRTTIHELLRCIASSSLKLQGVEVPYESGVGDAAMKEPLLLPDDIGEKIFADVDVLNSTNSAVHAYTASVAEQLKFVKKYEDVFRKYGGNWLIMLNEASNPYYDELCKFRDMFNHPEDRGNFDIARSEQRKYICATFMLQNRLDSLFFAMHRTLQLEICRMLTPLEKRIVTRIQTGIYKRALIRNRCHQNQPGELIYRNKLSKLNVSTSSDERVLSIAANQLKYKNDMRPSACASNVVMLKSSLLLACGEISFKQNNLDKVLCETEVPVFPRVDADSKLAGYVEDVPRVLSWIDLVLDFWHTSESASKRESMGPDARYQNMVACFVAISIHVLQRHGELYNHNANALSKIGAYESPKAKKLRCLFDKLRNITAHGPDGFCHLYEGDYYFGILTIRSLEQKFGFDPIAYSTWKIYLDIAHEELCRFYSWACRNPQDVQFPENRKKRSREQKSKPCT